MDGARPRSLFAVVYYYGKDPPHYSILQLDHEYTPEEMKKTKVDEKMRKTKVVEKVRFNLPQEQKDLSSIKWLFPPWLISPLKSCTDDLYMVPNWYTYEAAGRPVVKPLHGCKFNFRTGSFLPINLPDYYKSNGHIVNLSGHIYFISHDWYDNKRSIFKCYDPDKKSWKALEPFPRFACFEDGSIVATAVWGDTILLFSGGIWAYDVSTNKWYPVHVDDNKCKDIVGVAVVIGDTIYALTDFSVLVLSIKKEGNIDDHLVFKCSLLSTNKMMKQLLPEDNDVCMRSRDLVHLGKDKFCVVQSCDLYGSDCQPIQLTYIKIKRDNSVIVTEDEYFHQVKIQPNEYFMVTQCFSLPKDAAATALQEGGKSFNVDPYREDYEQGEIVTLHKDRLHATFQLDNDSSQTNIIDKQLAKGSSIYVRNLPPNATVRQVEKVLAKFGPIKSDGIRVGKYKDICPLLRGKLFASVEFESRSSMKCAIAASPISIGGCQAKILEKKLTGLTLDDHIIQAVMNTSNDDENEPEPDDSSVLPNVSSKEALQATITLQNYLLQHEQNIPEVVYALQKVKDGIEFGLAK